MRRTQFPEFNCEKRKGEKGQRWSMTTTTVLVSRPPPVVHLIKLYLYDGRLNVTGCRCCCCCVAVNVTNTPLLLLILKFLLTYSYDDY